jgi:hypothetical protein
VRAAPNRDFQAIADANDTAVATSAADAQRAISAGRRSIAAFQTRRASS